MSQLWYLERKNKMILNDFLNVKNFSWFKDQKKIKMENYNEIYKFYNIRYNNATPPFYHCIPLYNTIINNN